MRWAGHVAHMGRKRNECRVLVVKYQRKKDHLLDLGVEGRLILRWSVNKYDKMP
jgi:hypothetical protein